MKRLSIAYLLADTELAGGIRVALAQADALIERGHHVRLITPAPRPAWRTSQAQWIQLRDFGDYTFDGEDFIVGTYWTTLEHALRIGGHRALHLCQGFEGFIDVYRPILPQIEAAYRLPLPKITVSPHLVDVCRRYYPDAEYIGQIVDSMFYQPRHRDLADPPRVLLVGPMQAGFKGIEIGYAAVRQARHNGARFDLIRVSQWPPAAGEPADQAHYFHVGLSSSDMAQVIASCDIFLGPSRFPEGFGLPAVESMASGLPAVLTSIPSFLAFAPRADFALFVPEDDSAAMASALSRMLAEPALRRRLSGRGREVAEAFRAARTGERLEAYFLRRLPG